MPNLKEVRNRITSVSSTRQITSAMKLVSAAKLKRAQDAITRMKPYAAKLRDILENLSQSVDSADNVYATQREPKNILLIVVTSNRGLCGAFNSAVIKRVNLLLDTAYAEAAREGRVKMITIGKKATSFFSRRKVEMLGSYDHVYSNLEFEEIIPIAEYAMEQFRKGQVDKVEFVYNQFRSASTQVVTVEQFLPVVPPAQQENESAAAADYIFEPSKEEIVENLIPISLKTQFFRVLLDSHAAEHGARMTAMHKATDNAGELLKELKLSYNKARQAAITNEILEISAGAEALNG